MGKKSKMEKEEKLSSNANELFDNPMTKSALAALSDDDKKRYKMIGDHLYDRVNFENEKATNNMLPCMDEAVAYIEESIHSGLHPSMLEDNEKALLKESYGEEWYNRWGYVKDDLTDIVTLNPILDCKDKNI